MGIIAKIPTDVPTRTVTLLEALELYTAPNGEFIGNAQKRETIIVYIREVVGKWTQVEYRGRGSWAVLPMRRKQKEGPAAPPV